MKNVHVLSPDIPSKLLKNIFLGLAMIKDFTLDLFQSTKFVNVHITNSAEIEDQEVHLCTKYNQLHSHKHRNNTDTCKKIILTTDQDLINDGVQAIDDEFLDWFVKNSSCEVVKIDSIPVNEFGSEIIVTGYGFDKFIYKIIIPKEEPKQDTTLEEREPYWDLVDAKAEQNNRIDLDAYANGVLDGVKWQGEKSYSEEEVYDILVEHTAFLFQGGKSTLSEWFKQFKKK